MIQKNKTRIIEHRYANGQLMYQKNILVPNKGIFYHGEAKGWYSNGLLTYHTYYVLGNEEGEEIDFFNRYDSKK